MIKGNLKRIRFNKDGTLDFDNETDFFEKEDTEQSIVKALNDIWEETELIRIQIASFPLVKMEV